MPLRVVSKVLYLYHKTRSFIGRWVQDEDVNGLVSALINISSGNVQKDHDAKDKLIIQELFRSTRNDRLYLLLVQLQNEPVHEKTNLAALTMCNDIIQARTIKVLDSSVLFCLSLECVLGFQFSMDWAWSQENRAT